MKNLLLIIIVCLIAGKAFADHIIVQGEVSGQWNVDTVLVIGDLSIPDGETLLINPGTLVLFQGSYVINVKGAMIAAGNDNDTIYFSIADSTGFHADTIPDGGWRGIRLDDIRTSNETSVFYRCRFTYGKNVSQDTVIGNGGAIYVNKYNKVVIDECRFQDNFTTYNGGAVYLDSADITIKNSVFVNNRCGPEVAPWGYGGAIAADNSSPDIRWNVFSGNSSTGIGGGMSVRYKDCNIYNNVFSGNFSGLGGGLGILHIPECTHRINTNLFAENIALYFGGGVANVNASPVYINNTIVGNSAMYGGGFYCNYSISPDFYNTIFWGNQAGVGPTGYLFAVSSQADFYYCDVEGGPAQFGGSGGGVAFSGAFEQCLDEDPQFRGAGEHPYELTWDSPCYETGSPDTSGFYLPETDLADSPRLSHGAIDMGAYEIVWVGVREKETGRQGEGEKRRPGDRERIEDVKIWPNPFTDRVFVEVDAKKGEAITIEVFDISGRKLKEAQLQNPGSGKQQFMIGMNDLPTGGIYLIRTVLDKNFVTCKLVRNLPQSNTE